MKQFLLYVFALLTLVACTPSTPSFKAKDIAIIPQPVKMVLKEHSFKINGKTVVYNNHPTQTKAVDFLKNMLETAGIKMEVANNEAKANFIFISDTTLPKEGYRLEISPDKVQIYADDEAGYFYAIQSIRQMLPSSVEQGTKAKEWYLPCCEIEDYPRFSWRGSHLDVSRHFFSVEEVKRFIDYLALYKINIFHMHLSDDEGWRLEIKKYPLLTEKGAWRIESSHDKICKESAKTDSTFTIDPAKYQLRDGKKMYGGFYTQEDMRDLIRYANERCITIVPEIDMPGHFKAAIDNYPYLSCTGAAGWGKTFSTPACLAKEETYAFAKDILTEVAELFPSEYIHIGGDEVNIQSWKDCPNCQQKIRQLNLKDEHEYQSHFNREIEQFLKSKGKKLLGWDEIVEGGITKEATTMWWRSWVPDMRDKAADNGNDIIMTPCFEYYLNEKNANTTPQKVYEYEAIPSSFTQEQAKQVKGVQACLWTEWIANFKRLQYQMFPRIMAVAESGWTPAENKDYESFNERLIKQYDRLEAMDIYYYIAAPQVDKHIVLVDSALVDMGNIPEGVHVYYTTDGSEPNATSIKYEKPFYVYDSDTLKSVMCKAQVYSEVLTTKIEKQDYMPAVDVKVIPGEIKRCAVFEPFKDVESAHLPKNPQWTLVKEINMGEYSKRSMFSLFFEGYFKAEKDAVYSFSTHSDDGSFLYINDKLVVNNGENHSAKSESGAIALAKGWHRLRISYCEAGGAGTLAVKYAIQGEELKPLQGDVIGYKQ